LRYVTRRSADPFKWVKVSRKQAALDKMLDPEGVERVSDTDTDARGAAIEMLDALIAEAADDPFFQERAELQKRQRDLEGLRRAEMSAAIRARTELAALEQDLPRMREWATDVAEDAKHVPDLTGDAFRITIGKQTYTKRAEAAAALLKAVKGMAGTALGDERIIGKVGPFTLGLRSMARDPKRGLLGAFTFQRGTNTQLSSTTFSFGDAGAVGTGYVTRIENFFENLPTLAAERQAKLAERERDLATRRRAATGGFSKEAEAKRIAQRLSEIEGQMTARKPKAPPPPPPADSVIMYGVVDPFSAALYVAMQEMKRWYGRSPRYRPLVEYADPRNEATYRKSRGLLPTTVRERVEKQWRDLLAARHHFPTIRPGESVDHAWAHNVLLEVEHYKRVADTKAAHAIQEIAGNLDANQVDLFNRLLVLRDMQKDVENGLYDDHPIGTYVYGVDDATGAYDRDRAHAEITAEIARFEQEVGARPEIQAAYERRERTVRALTLELVANDLLPASVLDDPRYYHRQVLAYMRTGADRMGQAGEGQPDVRQRTKGYQRERVGGGDWNTKWQEAEFEWMAQAHRQLHLADVLRQIHGRYDLSAQLRRAAKEANRLAFRQHHAARRGVPVKDLIGGKDDPLLPYTSKMAMSYQRLTKLIADGDPTALAHLPPGVTRSDVLDAIAAAADHFEATGERVNPDVMASSQWFRYFNDLLTNAPGTDAAIAAATVLKAMADMDRDIRDTIGDAYLTWDKMVPEGYKLWQPVKGLQFYQGLTIEARLMDEIVAGTRPAVSDDFRSALIVAGPRTQWVLPEWLIPALDQLQAPRADDVLAKGYKGAVQLWKWQILQAPWRLVKYNVNNAFGDADAAMMAPRIFRHAGRAAADLWKYHFLKSADPELLQELEEASRLRVLDSGMSLAEIPDLAKIPQLQKIADESTWGVMRLLALYPAFAREITQWRENVMRLAAWRAFQADFAAGRNPGALASNPNTVAAARSAERAAILANDLIGDYGSISRIGQGVKDTVIPFFSWWEINAKRYVWLFRNAVREGRYGKAGQAVASGALRAGVRVGWRVAQAGVLANVFLLGVSLWNRWMWPEEDDRFRRTMKGGYLLLGYDDNGRMRWMRAEGAFRDFLEWVARGDWPDELEELVEGRLTLGDVWEETWKAPINRIAQGWEPASKTMAEVITKRKFYPDVFTANKRPARERAQVLAHGLGAGWLYDRLPSAVTRPLLDRPRLPSDPGRGVADILLLSRSDQGADAWFYMRERVARFLDEHDRARGGGEPTRRSTALAYWRRALSVGDEENAREWLQQYVRLGGTPDGLRASMRMSDPLATIPKDLLPAFTRTFTAEDRQILQDARAWAARLGAPRPTTARP
ncbi:MAG: hypothetical protein IPM13_17605, partial [Phycisphaerales bacterium]|nr:hypothetical protein [Phycisphaerales bacterium]